MACKCVKPRYPAKMGRFVDGAWEEANDTLDEPAACGECDGVQREPVVAKKRDGEADRARRIANTKALMAGRVIF